MCFLCLQSGRKIYLIFVEASSRTMQYLLDNRSHLLLSVSDSRASKTAAPINRYVNVHTTSDNVRTFWRFIVQVTSIPHTLSLRFGISIWFSFWYSKCSTVWVRTYTCFSVAFVGYNAFYSHEKYQFRIIFNQLNSTQMSKANMANQSQARQRFHWAFHYRVNKLVVEEPLSNKWNFHYKQNTTY